MAAEGVKKISQSVAKKRILMLQGPIGPFFSILQKQLTEDGHEVRHVIFNFADWVYSSRKNILVFRKAERDWHDWIRNCLIENDINLLILFGCERDRHAIAKKVADGLDIPVLSLEEGYVRPGYITAEKGGNNRHSPLKDLPAKALKSKPEKPFPAPASTHSFGKMAWYGFYYYNLRVLGLPFFARALHHKNRPVVSEAFYWVRNAYRKSTRRAQNFALIERLLESHRGDFYVVPLQVRDDMQLVKAGRGWTNRLLVEKSIKSFAAHAPKDRFLVIKVHPLERGHTNMPKRVKQLAEEHGCGSRVICLDDGSIGLLARDSAGMLTINSSSAFSAMLRKIPLGVIGDAMFRRSDIAYCINDEDDLDKFWHAKPGRKQELAHNFRDHMRATALVPGDYYLAEHREETARKISGFIDAGL